MTHTSIRTSRIQVALVACLWTALAVVSRLDAQRAVVAPLSVAAASDLQTVMPSLLMRFEKVTGVHAAPSFGSSGTLFAQIQNGAPFDVFFSADVDYPRRLVTARQADEGSLYEYATGRLVLWTRKDSGFDVRKGLDVLRDPRVRRIAIANPDLAPYGRAAVGALSSARVYEAVRGKLVFGENVLQAAQLAESGNADAALLPHTLALGRSLAGAGSFADIPSTTHPSIVQAAVIVSSSKNKEAARALLKYLQSNDVRQMLEAGGFGPPPRRF